jgi:hypothetical protein
MAKSSKPRNLSKTFLLGVAVSTLPLAGCELFSLGGDTRALSVNQSSATATAAETALYERARDQGTVAAAEEFLRTYPNSNLIARLLRGLSGATLQRINDDIVAQLDPRVVNTLPFNVKQALGIVTRSAGRDDDSSPSDGYSG